MSPSRVGIRYITDKIRPAREGWADFAKCKGEDTSEFVYDSEVPSKKARVKLEKICEGCPVLRTCRLEALLNMDIGWWGGMDERERITWALKNLKQQESKRRQASVWATSTH